jgi:hypothetical protein
MGLQAPNESWNIWGRNRHMLKNIPRRFVRCIHVLEFRSIDMGGLILPDVVKESGKFVIAVGEKPQI